MGIGEESLSSIVNERWYFQNARSEATACLTLIIYEWMLSFAEEVDLIHRKRWTWFKVLYLTCRYIPFIGLASTVALWQESYTRDFCLRLVHYQNASLNGLQVFPHLILLVRCYVFIGRRRWFLIFSIITTSSSFVVQAASVFGEIYLVDNQFELTGKYGCLRDWRGKNQKQRDVGIFLMLPLIIDGISVITVLRHHCKNREGRSPLSRLFVQQAVLGFSVVFFLSLLSGAFQVSGSPRLDGKCLIILLTMPNVMACRLILQLRRAAATPTPSEVAQQISDVVRFGLHSEEPIEPPPSNIALSFD